MRDETRRDPPMPYRLLRVWLRRAYRLWRRLTYCQVKEHRETTGCAFGILQWRCVDCGATRQIGWVTLHASNKAHHHRPEGDQR